MFLDEKPQGEVTEAPTRTLKLSEAIRIGAKALSEHYTWYLRVDERRCGCAVGTAAYGLGMRDNVHHFGKMAEYIGMRIPGITFEFLKRVEEEHVSRRMDRLQIADWLEAHGL